MSSMYPAFQSKMAGWTYYATTMKLKEVADKVNYADQLPDHETVSLKLQRVRQSERSASIVRYLKYQTENRFFGSIIVAAIDTSERGRSGFTFHPLEITPDALEANPMLQLAMGIDEAKFKSIGMLGLSSDVHFYALDGQHRLAAIKDINEETNEGDDVRGPIRANILNDEVSVIFIEQELPYDTESKFEFVKRYKSLFSNLNRYAKPTDASTNILMDQSDGFALLTIKMLENFKLFKYNNEPIEGAGHFSKIKLFGPSENIAPNSNYFTHLISLYKCNINLLNSEYRKERGWPHHTDPSTDALERVFIKKPKSETDLKLSEWGHQAPQDDILEAYYDELNMIWEAIFELFPELQDNSQWGDMRQNRKRSDGIVSHPLLRPVLLVALTERFRYRIDEIAEITKDSDNALTKDKIIEALAPFATRLKWDLFEYPFKNLAIASRYDVFEEGQTIEDYFSDEKDVKITLPGPKVQFLIRLIEWITGIVELDDSEVEKLKIQWSQDMINHKFSEQTSIEGQTIQDEIDKTWKIMTDMII